MSKWMKTLGISAAIGTVVYAVLKYKSDEKFKKKVDDTVEEVKEKVQETGEKVSKFVNEHPGTTTLIIAGVGLTIGMAHAIKADRKRQELIERSYQEYHAQYTISDPADEVNEEARKAAEKQMMYDDIMANPQDYYVIKKDDYNDLVEAYNKSVSSESS